jgi:hypothetical protein
MVTFTSFDKTLLFMGRTIETFLGVRQGKRNTTTPKTGRLNCDPKRV